MSTWKLLHTGANTGAYNMALDEKLLAWSQAGEKVPVLRFYTWDPPTVSLGRFQKIETTVDTAACRKHGIDVVKRVTGGRAVLHREELSYSIIARVDNPLFPDGVLGTYRTIASCLAAGLQNLGIPAEIVARGSARASLAEKREKNPACFSSSSWYEIVVNGRKIIGSAQRRLSHSFLQHGSIFMDFDPALEAEVIPGSCIDDTATSIKRELAQSPSCEDIVQAFIKGFRGEMRVDFLE
jgi:lipoyl(octanoyl) transferase